MREIVDVLQKNQQLVGAYIEGAGSATTGTKDSTSSEVVVEGPTSTLVNPYKAIMNPAATAAEQDQQT